MGRNRMFTAMLAVLVSVVVKEVTAEVYPFPSFLRTFYQGDPYASSYCVLTGSEAVQQGTGSQQYQGVQACSVGQIGLSGSEIGVGLIGGVGGAVVDLGTASDLYIKYNLTDYFEGFFSLRFNEGSQQFLIGTSPTLNLPTSITDPLKTTISSKSFEPVTGHIYIARLTANPTTTTDWSGTILFAKIIVVDGTSTNPILRWELLLGATTDSTLSITDVAATADSAHSIATASIVLLVLTLVFVIGGVAYTFVRTGRFSIQSYDSIKS